MSSRIAYNQREVDLLARLIRAEAVGEGDPGHVISRKCCCKQSSSPM